MPKMSVFSASASTPAPELGKPKKESSITPPQKAPQAAPAKEH
jgi:hypothetical protein